jgi:hypothetical protein
MARDRSPRPRTPPHRSTAKIQTAIGLGLTTVSIQLVPVLAETAGWQYSFLLLVPGPALGVLAMSAINSRPTAATTGST